MRQVTGTKFCDDDVVDDDDDVVVVDDDISYPASRSIVPFDLLGRSKGTLPAAG